MKLAINCHDAVRRSIWPGFSVDQESPEVSSPCGRLCLFGEVRLHNRVDLQKQLSTEEAKASDKALFLAAFALWHRECLKMIKGEFAAAILDRHTHTLYLAVDYCGNRSLFWRVSKQAVSISTQLQKLRFGTTHLNKDMLCRNYFRDQSFQSARPDETLYEEIHRVPPGHCVAISITPESHTIDVQLQRYWSAQNINPHPVARSELPEVIDSFQQLFEQSVMRRLGTDDAIAAHLSGGFDSSSVAAVAARERCKTGQRLHAFVHTLESQSKTVVPIQGRSIRELRYARAVARLHPNIELHTVAGRNASVLDLIDRQLKHSACYALNYDNMGYLSDIAARAHALGATTILTGERGNAAFSFPGHPQVGLLRRLARKVLKRGNGSQGWQPYPIRAQVATPLFLERYQHVKLNHRNDNFIDLFMSVRSSDSAAYFKNGMGVEHCDPTTDIDLTSFVWSLPNWVFCEKGESRKLIREASKAWLPDEIRLRKDRGLQGGDSHTHFNNNLQQIRDAMVEVELTRDYFNWRALELYVDEVAATPPQKYSIETMHKINAVYGAIAINKLCLYND